MFVAKLRVGKNNAKNKLWNNKAKTAMERKGDAFKGVLGPRDNKTAKEICKKIKSEGKRRVKRCI